jgi:cyclopropane-fatty-acyl-phospholipid synthase
MAKSLFVQRGEELLSTYGIVPGGDKPWDIQIHDKTIYRDTLLKGTLGFGDGYTMGKWDVEQMDVFFEKLFRVRPNHIPSLLDYAQYARYAVVNTQAGRRAFDVAHKHYDLGNDMYEMMLGESMGYSSGLYVKQGDDLTTAQYNKFDALCKKLQLKPGMKILEIGSGWGTFARLAAHDYGVEVVSLTVSKEQMAYAANRCKGLKVEFKLMDYRDLEPKYNNHFDRVVSIEMIEAVGKKNFKNYFKKISYVLKDDGILGLQAITGSGQIDTFISTRIFPNGLVPSQQQIIGSITGLLTIKQWDSFGKDYDKTLMAWDNNFQKNWPKISKLKDKSGKQAYDEQFYRMWRYYLNCCAAAFRVGYNDVAQILMTKKNTYSVLK